MEDNPLACSVEIAGQTHVRFILDRPQMHAVERESLNAVVSAVGHDQQGFFSPRVHPLPVRSVHFSVARTRLTNLTQELSGQRKTQHVTRSVAVPYVKLAIRGERDIR